MTLGQNRLRLGQTRGLVSNREHERLERINRLIGVIQEETETECRMNREERRRNNVSRERRYPSESNSVRGRRAEYARFLSNEDRHRMGCRLNSVNTHCDYNWYSSIIMTPLSNRESNSNRYIKLFNYVPKEFNFHRTELDDNQEYNNLYMGIELEIDRGGESEDNAKFIQEFLGDNNCYIMHDGSLKDGLEIVTHPCTLNYHKSLPYEELFEQLVGKGYKSHNTQTCGLHVHVNRDFFGDNPTIQDLCITKILYLLEKHWDKVKLLARRDSNGYAQRFFMNEQDSMFDLLAKAKRSDSYFGSSKYKTVNLLHKNTIEFRLFKGTLKYETLIATLEFVRNLVYLCKNKPLEQIQITSFEEILFVLDSEYLLTYLNERGVSLSEKRLVV